MRRGQIEKGDGSKKGSKKGTGAILFGSIVARLNRTRKKIDGEGR
jgi:hypothetical protein